MAELLLKIGDSPTYSDGDILHAYTDNHILMQAAERLCHPWKATPNENRLLDENTKEQDFFELTHQYKFVRNGSQVTRIDLASTKEEDVSDQMDVELYIARRMAHLAPNGSPKKAIFGTPGDEIWYGGNFDITKASAVWDMLEQRTSEVRTKYKDYPWDLQVLREYLVIPIDNITEERSGELVSPKLDLTDPENPVTIAKRAFKIDYVNDLQLSQETLDKLGDKTQVIEKQKNITYDESLVITQK